MDGCHFLPIQHLTPSLRWQSCCCVSFGALPSPTEAIKAAEVIRQLFLQIHAGRLWPMTPGLAKGVPYRGLLAWSEDTKQQLATSSV